MSTNIHPEFHRFLSRQEKEQRLGQRGIVVWMTGLSGSGKSTIANEAERVLFKQNRLSVILDGDNLRTGLNNNLGFSYEDRLENVRRTAETAKIFAEQGFITFVSIISPMREMRDLARDLIGDDYLQVYVKASYQTCSERDPKGLYEKARLGELKDFTGNDSGYEEPEHPDLLLDTESNSVQENAEELIEAILPKITLSQD